MLRSDVLWWRCTWHCRSACLQKETCALYRNPPDVAHRPVAKTPHVSTVEDIQRVVKEKYGQAARQVSGSRGSAVSCCGAVAWSRTPHHGGSPAAGPTRFKELPEKARCWPPSGAAIPPRLARPSGPARTVLDLGSGGGIDVLLSARRIRTQAATSTDWTWPTTMLELAPSQPGQGRRDKRGILEGRGLSMLRCGRLGRRHHLQLCHQSVGRQATGAPGSFPCAAAGRSARSL